MTAIDRRGFDVTGAGPTGAGLPFLYVFSAAISGDPGSGKLLFNNATFLSATSVSMSKTDADGTDLSAFLATFDDSTSASRCLVTLTGRSGQVALFHITGAVTDHGTYDTWSITPVSISAGLTDGDVVTISAAMTGDQGATGSQGAASTVPGPTGATGSPGTSPGLFWNFEASTTMAAPSAGGLRLNNASFASVTAIAVNATSADSGNPSVSTTVNTWDDSSTTAHRGNLIIRKISAPANYAIYDITGATTDNTTWLQLAVTAVSNNGSFSAADQLCVEWLRTGDAGSGTIAGATSHGVGIATAANAMTSTAVMADGQLLVGQSAANPLPKTITGDVTFFASGASTIAAQAVTYAKMQNVSATACVLGRKSAGAGSAEECALSDVLDFVGSAAAGDMLYRGTSTWTRLPKGSDSTVLTLSSGVPTWSAGAGSGQPVPNGAPSTWAVGTVGIFAVITGTVNSGSTIAGGNICVMIGNSTSSTLDMSGGTATGTWKNISGIALQNGGDNIGPFVRTA